MGKGGRPTNGGNVEKTVYTCDVCGIDKKESNHWYRAKVDESIAIFPWDYFGGKSTFPPGMAHLCGHACVLKTVDRFLGGAAQ